MRNLKKIILVCILCTFCYLSFPTVKPSWVHNSLKEIDACEGKIKLILVKIWGDDTTDDENQFFRYPKDIKIDTKGIVYILDAGNNRIQVFDRKGNYKKTISRRGQGPGEILQPMAIDIDVNGNITVLDYGNNRIQTLDSSGNYLHSFKTGNSNPSAIVFTKDNKIAASFLQDQFKGNSLITLLNSNGTVEGKIGKPHFIARSHVELEAFYLAMDKDSNFYLAFWGTSLLRKLSKEGDPLLIITFEVPYKSTIVKINPTNNEPQIKRIGMKRVTAGLFLDCQSRIFLVAAKRDLKKSERIGFVSDGHGNWRRVSKQIESEITDRFKLMVFNPQGKIIAACQLNVYCDKIYIYGDHLFIIDTNMGMKIYEYQITFI